MSDKDKDKEDNSQPKKKLKTSSNKISRAISACKRCRSKKIKCDQKFPQCTKCQINNVECIGVDPVTGREIPRSYIVYLEDKIKNLENKLNLLEGGNVTEIEKSKSQSQSHFSPIEKESPGSNSITFSKLVSTALKVSDNKEVPSEVLDDDSLPAVLPPKYTALQFLQIYFHQCNSQLPLFHREEFIQNYFIPIYGSIDLNQTNLASNNKSTTSKFETNECWFDSYKIQFQKLLNENLSIPKISNQITPPRKYYKALYFLNLVFAIASSVHHLKYPKQISNSFLISAMKYKYEMEDALENLSAILLYAYYSIMRPTNPGIWYIMGQVLRITVDLDLQNEKITKSKQMINIDNFTRDKRRRIFWCCYSIDRQICFYLDRPFGIPDESINTPYPCLLDDSNILPGDIITNYNAKDVVSYKNVSLAFFEIRKIQSEVTKILYTSAEIPRAFNSLTDWKEYINKELENWYKSLPDMNKMNCDFNLVFFKLNYHHTLLYLNGLCPKNYKLTLAEYKQVALSSKEIIESYAELLLSKSINYTWAGVHNLFSAGTSFLYALYNSAEIREIYKIGDVSKISQNCLYILYNLIDRCDAAKPCYEIFQKLTQVIIKLKYNGEYNSVIEISKESLYDINGGNVHSNLFHLVSELDHLNPLKNVNTNIMQSAPNDVENIQIEWNDSDLDLFFNELNKSEGTTPTNREGEKTFELIHNLPNEKIWDQYFTNR
ncbi:unnamed protein product [Candida verbasci]|uniref:Zn(2)-C6 fungal-type domain-containing protein n=1 Tax=Candida verbasci TaxID=1227364 RepID=A0A9W4TYI8_9ASCO|nr:unnamed protein product [Candida verbasci]